MNQVYTLLGFAHKAGAAVSGETAVTLSLRRSKTQLLLVATDASENTKDRFTSLAKGRNIPHVMFGTAESLGRAIGKPRRVALAIESSHFARAIQRSLADEN